MELKEFISSTLCEILMGVSDAIEKTKNTTGAINPSTGKIEDKLVELKQLLTRQLNRGLLSGDSCILRAWTHKMHGPYSQQPKNNSGNKRFASSSKG